MLARAGVLLLCVYGAMVVFGPRGPVAEWVYELVPVAVPAIAAFLCFDASRRSVARWSWTLFGAGAASWAIGDAGFTVIERLGHEPDGFSPADVGYLLLVPLWCAALVVHPVRGRRRAARVGAAVNALIGLVAVGTLVVAFVLLPVLAARSSTAPMLVNLAYPVGDLVMLGVLLGVLARADDRLPRGEVLIVAAVVVFAVGDVTYAFQAFRGTYETGSLVDLTWIAAFVCVAVAARVGLVGSSTRPVTGRDLQLSAALSLVPAVLLVAAAALSPHREILLAGASAVVLLILLRYTIVLVENRRLVDELAGTVRDLRRMSEAQDEFVAAASHQLRTPLTSIRLRVDELVAQGGQPPEAEQDLREILDEVTRLQTLSDRLLALLAERSDAATLTASVRDGVARVVHALAPLARAKQVDLVAGDVPSVQVAASEDAFEETLSNLVENGIKHSPLGGSVDIRVEVAGAWVSVSVVDRGSGIDEAIAPKVFEPFFRGPGGRGYGLGLAIARRLVTSSGGTIGVAPGDGEGTVLVTRWPRVLEQDHGSDVATEPAAASR